MNETTRKYTRRVVKVGAGAGVIALAFAQAPSSEAREALSGQCGVDGKEVSYTINSDGSLSMAVTGNGKGRVARFRFYGGNSGSNYYWDAYQYRYGVTETNYGPQSNEIVRFGQQRNDPGDSYWSQYYSPDSHNSNLPGSAPVQSISGWFTSPGGNTEIWTKAIFDVPGQPDPSCWTNAIATK